ncbi:hypothetical protein B0T16DRAFT_106470 [Cercophora newfieldiana]|uniref:Uncharacterized protein n=1 Tax=Cercophora newfieldiana TaxID=92897 RepID=A0AA39YIC3_9PEZI|nr:hypothetical protein B0T16DRAFT_106470 [Cercophora newfieldiana]
MICCKMHTTQPPPGPTAEPQNVSRTSIIQTRHCIPPTHHQQSGSLPGPFEPFEQRYQILDRAFARSSPARQRHWRHQTKLKSFHASACSFLPHALPPPRFSRRCERRRPRRVNPETNNSESTYLLQFRAPPLPPHRQLEPILRPTFRPRSPLTPRPPGRMAALHRSGRLHSSDYLSPLLSPSPPPPLPMRSIGLGRTSGSAHRWPSLHSVQI